MSLNGLDDPAIIESYQTALAEAGGWFLLKYVGRDVLDLLGRGTGGVAEIKVSIDGYGETSPLYGFLQYRRRKVVLRYVPEGISRLVQARITVQFQSFLDKFSPHDTVFSLSVSTELTESALSSACSLHTASGSMTSSSSSLRRRRLVEITEDAEENGVSKEEPRALTVEKDTDALSQRSDATAVPSNREPTKDTDTRSTRTNSTSRPPRELSDYVEDRPAAAHQQLFLEQLSQPTSEPRKSSQSTRPSTRDLDLASLYKPKVKLGPRPSADNNGRPRTAGSLARKQGPGPVATMPAGIRSSASQRSNSSRPKSQPSSVVPPLTPSRNIPPVPSFSISTTLNTPSVPRPPLSPSVKSFMTSPEPGVTPEKQRLMRALQLRQKQIEKRAEEKKKAETKEPKVEVEEVGEVDNKENAETVAGDKLKEPVDDSSNNGLTHEEQTQDTSSSTATTDIKPPSPDPSKADSAVDIVVTEAQSAKPTESTTNDMATPAVDAVDVSEPSQEPPPDSSNVADPAKDKVADTDEVVRETSTAEQNRISPELDTGLQDSEQDSSSINETGSPSHETSTTTLDMPEDIDSTDLKKNEETPTKATDTTSEDNQVSPISKEVEAVIANKEPVPEQEVSADSNAVIENDAEPEAPEAKVETSEAQKPDTSSEDIVNNEPQPDATAAAEKDTVDLNKTQNNEDAVSDEPSGNSSSTERPVETTEDQRRNKRRALAEPVQIPTDHEESDDDNLLSDDSFMDELTSATVQEAKPVSVAKSPIASSFASNDDDRSSRPGSRAVSNPNLKHPFSGDLQALPIGRSASGSYFDRSEEVPVLVAKKVNVSSGISKRIKALEMFSSREPSPGPTPAPPAHTGVSPAPSSSAFEKFRKRSSISQSTLPSGLLPGPKPTPSLTPSPSAESTASKSPTPSRKDSLSTPSVNRGKSNSVSVTARIIRDPPSSQNEQSPDQADSSVLNLQCSPLIVERETREEEPRRSSTVSRPDNRSLSVSSSTGSRRNSFASILPRSDSTANRSSGGSKSKIDAGSRSTSDLPSPLDSVDEGKEEKKEKESRKSRILRRMSSITSNSRRGVINSLSPTVAEEEAPVPPPKDEETITVPQVVDVGEVNVQFPDTLLWKRRFMRIDDQGYLILTPGNMDGTSRNIVKRYHLSEFRTPCLPDHDRQELPNSILLDFCDGSTLQCACESRQGQGALLQTLVEAHGAYYQVNER
ncbi:hypothetical protein FQN54_006326 [Arachnomyces sp. PD_36]|nr:hypothetical protein FQN54_006326 [Arachnomyces sp. PD_36]